MNGTTFDNNSILANDTKYVKNDKKYFVDQYVSLNGMTFSELISLPIKTSYIESCTYLEGYYYISCYDYSDDRPSLSYIAKYNKDNQLIDYQHISSDLTSTNSNITNDGRYLYVDFNSKVHRIYNTSFELIRSVSNTDYNFTAIYEENYYGIKIDNSNNKVVVYLLNNELQTIEQLFEVQVTSSTLQSANILYGILMIPTTWGIVKFIDIPSGQIISEVPYTSYKEIESFFSDDEGLKCIGHVYGFNGAFNFGKFNNGVDYSPMSTIPTDCSQMNFNWTSAAMQNGIYQITNGQDESLQVPFPEQSGDLVILPNLRLFATTAGTLWQYQTNAWRCLSRLNYLINITNGIYIGTSGYYQAYVMFTPYLSGETDVNYPVDRDKIETLFNLSSYSLSTALHRATVCGVSNTLDSTKWDMYVCTVTVTVSNVRIQVKRITTENPDVSEGRFVGKHFLFR